jgi:glycosyltransferase involved in cell wall biosynthesis
MRILFAFGYPVGIGGHYKSGLALAKCLVRWGHKICVMAPGGHDEMIRTFEDTGAQFIPFPKCFRRYRLPRPYGMTSVIKVCRKYSLDIIHAQDYNCLAACYFAATVLKAGFVYTKAGGGATGFPPLRAQNIVFSQELVEGMTKKYGLSRENISLIRARIDLEVYSPETIDDLFVEKYNLPRLAKKVVIATRLEPYKASGWQALLTWASKLSSMQDKEVAVVIVGEGSLSSVLQKQISQINRKNVNKPVAYFIGHVVSLRDMNFLYNYADIVAGKGRGILEAMACGKPVVVLGEQGQADVVSPENVEEIAKYNFSGRHFKHKQDSNHSFCTVVDTLLNNNGKLAELGDFSRKYIKNHMDARIGAKQLLEVYKKALTQDNLFQDYIRWNLAVATYKFKRLLGRKISSILKISPSTDGVIK